MWYFIFSILEVQDLRHRFFAMGCKGWEAVQQREAKMTGKSVLKIRVLTAVGIIILPRRFDAAVTGREQMKNLKPSGKYLYPIWNEYVLGEHKNSAHFAKRGAELKITVRVRMERIYCPPPSFSSCFPILHAIIIYQISKQRWNFKRKHNDLTKQNEDRIWKSVRPRIWKYADDNYKEI